MKITVRNDFHNTEASANAKSIGMGQYRLNMDQIKKLKNKLCPVKGCTCSDRMGSRGPQDYTISYDGFEYVQFIGPATKAELCRMERDYFLMRGQYGEDSQATIRALIRWEDAKEATAKAKSAKATASGL